MKKSYYCYTPEIGSPEIRGTEENRAWNLEKMILEHCDTTKTLLDIGCGTANKLLPFSHNVNFLVGIDINPSLLCEAQAFFSKNKITNALFVQGDAENLPFMDNQFDIITVMLAPFKASEIHRVLKPGGIAILEKVGDHDKASLKKMFGKDAENWRGYLFTDHSGNPQQDSIEEDFKTTFARYSIQSAFWKTYYTIDSLLYLLENTPTIRNFDRESDEQILEAVADSFSTEKGIEVTQNRLLIKATK